MTHNIIHVGLHRMYPSQSDSSQLSHRIMPTVLAVCKANFSAQQRILFAVLSRVTESYFNEMSSLCSNVMIYVYGIAP